MEINRDVIEYSKIVDELYNTYAKDISEMSLKLQKLSKLTGSKGALNKLIELLSKAVVADDNLFERRETLFLLASYSIIAIMQTDEEIKQDIEKEKECFQKYMNNILSDYYEDNFE